MDDRALFTKLMPYARRASKSASYRYGIDADDTEQQIYLVTLVALRGGAEVESMGAFLRLKVRDGISKSIAFHKRSEVNDDVDDYDFTDTDAVLPDMAIGGVTQHLTGVTKESLDILVKMYSKDETMAEIAEDMGKSRQSVQQAHKRAIDKIRSNMGVVL